MSEAFDFNKALAALQDGQDLTGKDGIQLHCSYYCFP